MSVSGNRARRLRRVLAIPITVLFVWAYAAPAVAVFPFRGTGADDSDPYAYQNYMFIAPSQYPPGDLGGDDWKYSSKNACDLYSPKHENCNPAINANAQELNGVTGASIDLAWEKTTGRPDVVIAVHDSGIQWRNLGAMRDLNNKVWLNRGELPLPDWGTGHPNDAYDRNADGIFNIKDYCPDWEDENNCGGTGDSRVRGAVASADTDYNANGIIDPEDLIFKFSDGVDTDTNGYKDDFVGWDTYEDDNDPYDEVDYGHGTGEARDSTAEVNNGGDAGVCPNCMVMPMRVGDSFIADVNNFAEGVVYATDNGASVIQSALGTLNSSRFAQQAIDYAYRRGVVLIASAADESAGHHNQPSVLEHGVTFNSIGEPEDLGGEPPGIASYLQFRGCTNYGAYITAAVPSNSCSSEAVGRTSGMAGLIYASARNQVAKGQLDDYGTLDGAGGVPAGRAVSAEEIDQIISTTADDINFVTPVLYTARPDLADTERYPATAGWDPFFGYGRVNAKKMVDTVIGGKIPPEADITTPKWFATVDPGAANVVIAGTVAARRSAKYSYAVKWGVWSWRDNNADPAYVTTGVTMTNLGDQTAPISGNLATISSSSIAAALLIANGPVGTSSGPAVDPATGRGDHENRQFPDKFGIIVQLEVTAKDAAGAAVPGVAKGIGTKNFNFHSDPALIAGFPKDLQGDGAAPPRFADLNNDGKDELIVATSNGEVHAYTSTGGELPGWPVYAWPQPQHASPGYSSGEISTPARAAILRSPAVGDLNRDGELEVVFGDFQGRLHAVDRFGVALPGFPVRTNPNYSAPQADERAAGYYAANPGLVPGDYLGPGALPNNPDLVPDLVNQRSKLNRTTRWFLPGPTLANLDGTDDDDLEILAGAGDRHIYAFNLGGSKVPGWPVFLRDPAKFDTGDGVSPLTRRVFDNDGPDRENSGQVIVSPAVGDINGDGTLDVLATVNEQYVEAPNTDDNLLQITSAAGLEAGNNRLYALFSDGSLHGAGPGSPANGHPNINAYMPGWPAKIATAAIDLLPVVGEGPDGSPIIGNVNGGNTLEVGIFGVAGPAYILNSAGASIYGKDPQGRDRTLLMSSVGAGSNSADSPSVPAVGGAIFTNLGTGLSLAAPAAGLGKLVDLALPDDQLNSDNHLSIWELGGSRAQLPAFPREVNDLHFLSTPASADIDGDSLEEVLDGTAYSDFHAFSAAGTEPGLNTLSADGWPKFTGGWSVGAPSVGDFNGDGMRDISFSTREGNLFAWNGNGADNCSPATWPEFGHDGWMTNNVGTDAVRPRKISNLSFSVASSTVTMSWTAPGDDGMCGTAQSYDIRYSTSPITPANFASATQFTTGVPNPGTPSATQTFAFAHQPCRDRYVAIRTWDANPATDTQSNPANPSAISNVILVPGQGSASCIALEPSDAARVIGTDHTVTATVLGDTGQPFVGATVTFTVAGTGAESPVSGSGVTNGDGKVTFTFTSTTTGVSVVTARVTFDSISVSDVALVTWLPEPPAYVSLVPTRILDTRDGTGSCAPSCLGPLEANQPRAIQITGSEGVPASGVSSVVLNVTVTNPTESSHLTVYPSGETRPNASNLNYMPGLTVANLVKVKLGADGKVTIDNFAGATDVIFDVAGYYTDGSSIVDSGSYTPLNPARILDTRSGNGGFSAAVGPGQTIDVQITGRGLIPTNGVSAAAINVTAVDAGGVGHLTVWPAGAVRPETSNLNFDATNSTVPNMAILKPGVGGKVSVRNGGSTGTIHVIFDVAGWYNDDTVLVEGGEFDPLTPVRILDTRESGLVELGPGESRDIQVSGLGGVPPGAGAVVMNVTAVDPTGFGHLTLFPADATLPTASNLNFRPGQTVPNLVMVRLSPDGKVTIHNGSPTGTVHVIFDAAGWFAT